MSKKYDIKTVKTEYKGIINERTRVTSRDTNGQVGVSEWQPSKAKAEQQSRERLSRPAKPTQ